jgi:hypothetical protein
LRIFKINPLDRIQDNSRLNLILNLTLPIIFVILLAIYQNNFRYLFINSDEANMLRYSSFDFFKLFNLIQNDAHLPLYPILLKIKFYFLSVKFMYLVNLIAFYLLLVKSCQLNSNIIIKILFCIFLATNPFVNEIFSELRPYSLVFLLTFLLLVSEKKIFIFLAAITHHVTFIIGLSLLFNRTVKIKNNGLFLYIKKNIDLIFFYLIISPLVFIQTLNIFKEKRYVSSSFYDESVINFISYKLKLFFNLLFNGPTGFINSDNFFYTSAILIFFTSLSALCYLLRDHLFPKISVIIISLLSIFAISNEMLGLQYFTVICTVFFWIILVFCRSKFSKNFKILILLTLLSLQLPSYNKFLKDDFSFYKVNYNEALNIAIDSKIDFKNIILVTFGIQGSSRFAFNHQTFNEYELVYKDRVFDTFDDFKTGDYVDIATIFEKITGIIEKISNHPTLIIYSSAPYPDIGKPNEIYSIIGGPWKTKPGDLYSIIVLPKT